MEKKEIAGTTFGTIAIIAVLVLVFGSFYSVPDGSVGVKYNKFGANQGYDPVELPQGIGFKVPFMQTVWDMPFRTQTIGFFDSEDGSSDYAAITPKDKNGVDYIVDITVRYRVDPAQVSELMEQKGKKLIDVENILATAARADSTRGVFGQYAQEDVPEQRIEIAGKIKKVLQERIDSEASGKLKPGFITIEAVDVRNVKFNQKIEDRIIEKQEKLQKAQEKEYDEQIAEADKRINIINANSTKMAAIIKAQGEAEAVKVVAFAKAEGLMAVNDAYKGMPAEYVSTKWSDAIKDTDKIIFGLESLSQGGNMLPIIDINEVAGLKTQGKVLVEEEE